MAYTILNTDGTTLLLLADNTVDESTTSLSLVGKNVSGYGQYINNNFIKILANSANTQGSPPKTPLIGQLWYDTTARRLKIYDNGFKAVGGAIVAAENPGTLTTGDLWWDTTNNQLKVYSGSTVYTVAPAFPKAVGENGWVLPNSTVNDDTNVPQQITFMKNYGQVVGVISNTEFDLNVQDSVAYFNTTTTATIVSGLTVNGDIRYTGQLSNKHLTADVDIEHIAVFTSSVVTYNEYLYQNQKIRYILQGMFPILADGSVGEVGVPIGSEARVLCQYANPAKGVQVRKFKVVDQPGTGVSWQPYEVYTYSTSTFGATKANVMYDYRV